MKMTSIEKTFLDKICADSCQDVTVVRNVLRAVLISIIKETYASYYNSDNKDNIDISYHIPYLLNMNLNCRSVLTPDAGEKTEITIDCKPCITLEKEINRIFTETSLEMEEFFKQEITLTLMKYLNFEKDTIIT